VGGICEGGGYAVVAIRNDHQFKAVAIVSAFNIGDGVRHGWYGNENLADHIADLDQVAPTFVAEVLGGEASYAPYVPPIIDDKIPFDLVEAHKYYCTPRAQHKNAQNMMLLLQCL
jgi:dienelactone hydrolase